jgi:hypothetical protein
MRYFFIVDQNYYFFKIFSDQLIDYNSDYIIDYFRIFYDYTSMTIAFGGTFDIIVKIIQLYSIQLLIVVKSSTGIV